MIGKNTRLYCQSLLILLIFAFTAGPRFVSATPDWKITPEREGGIIRAGKGWSTEINGLKVVYFKGSPRQIGAQMFHLTVGGNKEMQKQFNEFQEQGLSGNFFERTFKNLYARFKFIPSFKRYIDKEYLKELEGFVLAASEGRTGNINDLILGNAFQDLGVVYGGCSFFAAHGDATVNGDMIVGRNLDHGGLADLAKYQSLNFYHPEQGLKFVTLNYPSMVGVMQGMNEKGLVVAMAYSTAVEDEVTVDGLPYMILLRRILQYGRSIDEAVEIIKESPRTIGLNILVADGKKKEAVIVEVSAYRMAVRHTDSFIYSANRYLSDYMQNFQNNRWMLSALRESEFERYKKLWWGRFDIEHAIKVMRDKHDPSSQAALLPGIDNPSSIAAVIFNPTRGEVWVSNRGGRFSPDGSYIGISAEKIWKTASPVPPVGVIPETDDTGYNHDWRLAMEADMLSQKPQPDEKRIREILEPLVKKYPSAEYPLFLLGRSYIRTGDLNKGLNLLEKMVSFPETAEPYYRLAALYRLAVWHDHLGHRETAVKYYQAALNLPMNETFHTGILDICRLGLKEPLAVENSRVVPARSLHTRMTEEGKQ